MASSRFLSLLGYARLLSISIYFILRETIAKNIWTTLLSVLSYVGGSFVKNFGLGYQALQLVVDDFEYEHT